MDRLSKLELRVDNISDRIDEVHAYAEGIDANLRKFKKQFRKHLNRKAAVSAISAVVGVFSFGVGAGIVSAIGDASIFNKITDFGDFKHVIKTIKTSTSAEGDGDDDLAETFAKDRIEAWVEKPLEDAVKEDRIPRNLIQIAAVGQTAYLFSQQEDTPPPPKPDAPQVLPPSAPKKDAASTFAELKNLLELDESVKKITINDDFWLEFQIQLSGSR